MEDFSIAIDLEPAFADSWKRRGQARAAMEDTKGALADLNRCIELSKSKDQKVPSKFAKKRSGFFTCLIVSLFSFFGLPFDLSMLFSAALISFSFLSCSSSAPFLFAS